MTRRMSWRRVALAGVLAAVLAGCGTTPKPFQHEEGTAATLARPKLMRGVALRPAEGMTGDDALSVAVLKAFEDREVPVTLRRGPGFGRVIEIADENGATLWRLLGADGAELQRLTTPAALAPRLAAAQVAARFYPLIEDPDSKPQLLPGKTLRALPKVRVEPMKGLPGDGDVALPQALSRALLRERLEIAETAPYTVVGVVTVAKTSPTDDTVTISWLIKEGGASGPQLARIDQGGAVPRGRLDLTWGSLARDIAEGGASGIAEVLRKTENQRAEAEKGKASTNVEAPRQFTEPRPADIGKPVSSDQNDPARPIAQPPADPEPKVESPDIQASRPEQTAPSPQ